MNTVKVFGVTLICLGVAGAISLANSNISDSKSGLPTCESSTAENALKSIIDNGIMGKLGTKAVLVEDRKTITRTEKETKCTATLVLSQFGDRHVSYTITMRNDGRWLLRTVPTDE